MLNEAGKEIRVFIDELDSQFSTELPRQKLIFIFMGLGFLRLSRVFNPYFYGKWQ